MNEVHSTSKLRARQLQRQVEDLQEEVLYLQRMRLEGKKCHDEKNCIRDTELIAGDFVLLHNTRREKDMSIKLSFKWLSPYQISELVKNKSTYMLEELDGTHLAGTFAGDRLKIFHPRQELLLGNFAAEIDHEGIPDLNHLL